MRDDIELLFTELPFNGSLAIDLFPWTFLLGAGWTRHVISSGDRVWRELVLWLGPICITLTFYGGRR